MPTLSVYYDPHHDRQGDKDYIQRLQPNWVRIHQVTAKAIADVHRLAPNAKIMLRRWEIDDHNGDRKQEAYSNPLSAALKHAYAWDDALADIENELHRNGWAYDKSKWHVGLVNEPDPAHLKQIIEYTAESMRLADLRGRRLGVLVSSVGNFGKPGENNSWDLCKPLEKAINDGGHILIVHEYWQREGAAGVWTDAEGKQRHDAGNLAWRHRSIPLNVPILIGEAGANGYIYGRTSQRDDCGWADSRMELSAEAFAGQVRDYIAGCDTRVQGVCLYMTDYHDDQWRTFDTAPAHEQLLAIKGATPQVEGNYSNFSNSSKVYLPVVGKGTEWGDRMPEPLPQGIIDPLVLEAILQIESGGRALGADGRPVIRFEAHIFRNQIADDPEAVRFFESSFRYGSPSWTKQEMWANGGWIPIHDGNQATEWAAYDRAKRLLNEWASSKTGEERTKAYQRAAKVTEAAAQSISMGAAQIMGFNHASIGYPSATAMLQAFRSEPVQIIAFLNFVLGRPDLLQAVRGKDWRTIARIYNGQANVDKYAPLLEQTYNNLKGRN